MFVDGWWGLLPARDLCPGDEVHRLSLITDQLWKRLDLRQTERAFG
jgi:hypothetical protein